MSRLDNTFRPSLYLERDKQAIGFIQDRLTHGESCASVCMYGNGKDYLFTNVVESLEAEKLKHKLKVLNTVSSDELKDFADMLESENEPTICLVNLRLQKDVSWFVQTLKSLRVKRGVAFVSYVNAYVGDVYESLISMESPITHGLVILRRISYKDAQNIFGELSQRFEFDPTEDQKLDIYNWSRGHVGMLRTLFLLKRANPKTTFSAKALLREPMVLERLNNILGDLPMEKFQFLLSHDLGFVEKLFYEELGYTDAQGELFHPLLKEMLAKRPERSVLALSPTEARVLEYLRIHDQSVVSREEIAKIIWGKEEWEDKYSDWAIGQLIYRLRKKLEYASKETIQTRKGQGFIYFDAPGNSSNILPTTNSAASSAVL